jgi:hypothetical protein
MAGALIFLIFGWRPCRTSWLIVGTETRLLSFLLAALDVDCSRSRRRKAFEARLSPGSGPIDGNLRRRGGLRHPTDRTCGTGRDMEAI